MEISKEDVKKIIKALDDLMEKKINEVKRFEKPSLYCAYCINQIITEVYSDKLDFIFDEILNHYLDNMKELPIDEKVNEYLKLMRSKYSYNRYRSLPEFSKKVISFVYLVLQYNDIYDQYENVIDDGNHVATLLVKKKLGVLKPPLVKPVNVEGLIRYSISKKITAKEVYDELWYIIVYIAVHYNVLKQVDKIITNKGWDIYLL